MQSQIETLLEFAEDKLHEPLRSWQKDILTCLLNHQEYIAGRRLMGKQAMINIYDEWIKNPHTRNKTDEIGEVTLTYEQLMQ